MACDCNKPVKYYPTLNSTCTSNVNDDCCSTTDASCVQYTGTPLSETGIGTNKNLEVVLQELDTFMSTIGGNGFPTYNYYCLDDVQAITTQKQFVETISQSFCDFKTTVQDYIDNNPDLQVLQTTVDGIINPNKTSCSYLGVVPTDTYSTILNKVLIGICDLDSRFNVSTVNWSQAYPVSITPVTLVQSFDEVLRQIKLVKDSVSNTTLPTFNTTSACLPTSGTNVSLQTVVNELLAQNCQLGKFQFSTLTWGCVTAPTTETLQGVIQQLISVTGGLVSEKSTFDPTQFDVTALPGCQGYSIQIKDGILENDGLVYVNSSSTTRQYLADALIEGDNISLNVVGDKIEITATNDNEGKVAVTSTETPDYLNNVVIGGDYDGVITIQTSVTVDGKLAINPVVNEELLTNLILTNIQTNPTLLAKFCNLICSCGNCG